MLGLGNPNFHDFAPSNNLLTNLIRNLMNLVVFGAWWPGGLDCLCVCLVVCLFGSKMVPRSLGPGNSPFRLGNAGPRSLGLWPSGPGRTKMIFKLLLLAPQHYSDSLGPVAEKRQKSMISQHSWALAQWARQEDFKEKVLCGACGHALGMYIQRSFPLYRVPCPEH